MTYIPDKDGRARNIALSFVIFGVILYGISNFISYGALFQVVATVLLVAGVFMLVRYVLTDFVYIIDDLEDGNSDVVIIKKQGKKEVKVCHMSLSLAAGIYKGRPKDKADAKYNYCQNINADTHVICFTDGGKSVQIVFEPGADFVRELSGRMSALTNDGGTFFAM